MSKHAKHLSYRQRVERMRRKLKISLEEWGEKEGYTKWQVYAATRGDEPKFGTRYEIAEKLGLIEGEQA